MIRTIRTILLILSQRLLKIGLSDVALLTLVSSDERRARLLRVDANPPGRHGRQPTNLEELLARQARRSCKCLPAPEQLFQLVAGH